MRDRSADTGRNRSEPGPQKKKSGHHGCRAARFVFRSLPALRRPADQTHQRAPYSQQTPIPASRRRRPGLGLRKPQPTKAKPTNQNQKTRAKNNWWNLNMIRRLSPRRLRRSADEEVDDCRGGRAGRWTTGIATCLRRRQRPDAAPVTPASCLPQVSRSGVVGFECFVLAERRDCPS